jgi:DNA-binding response OmpR family regulator/tetratricopeptide (TPR) repeat protein
VHGLDRRRSWWQARIGAKVADQAVKLDSAIMAGYVLIVEKDADLQRRIGAALREAGYESAVETEAGWAKRSIAVRQPDAIVVDTRLADGDGFRLARDLRQQPEMRTMPIVFIASSHRGTAHSAEARRRFAPADYLPTPVDASALVPRLIELRRNLPPAASVDTEPTPLPVPKQSLRDPAQQRERRDVERSARTLVADRARGSWSGTLERAPLAQLLHRIYAERSTGSLLLLRDSVKKIVFFVDGYPVSARSNVLGECLGQILLERRLIGPEVLAQSVARMQRENRQQGQILVEMGALSPFNLERALVEQVEAKLLEVFSWPDGKFLFKAGDAPTASTARLERSPAALILEGIRRHYDSDRQDAVLARYASHFVALSPDPVLRLQDMTSDAAELAFIRSIDGSSQLDALLAGAVVPRGAACLLLVALSEAGMVQPRENTSRRKAGPLPAVLPGPAPLGSGELAMMLQMARTQDFFWVLGVHRDAPIAEIERSYESLARSFHADRYRLAPEDDRKAAQEMFARLTEAHRVLTDPAARRSYVSNLVRAESTDEPVTAVDAIPRGSLGVPPGPTNNAAKSLFEVGVEHLRARRHHQAVEALRQAARLVPNNADYRAELGWALFRQAPADARAGRAAVAELRRATQIDERHRAATMHLAEIFAQTGQPELAVAELQRLLDLDPSAGEVADELRRLTHH